MKHLISHTSNGKPVYIDLIHSQAASQISRQPRLLEMVKRITAQSKVDGTVVRLESNMGKPIGYNSVIKTDDGDTVFYAQQQREKIYTRFVKNGTPKATRYLSLVLHRDTDDSYELHELWLGRQRPARPGHDDATAESLEYWSEHAFIIDTQPVQPRTITRDCPY